MPGSLLSLAASMAPPDEFIAEARLDAVAAMLHGPAAWQRHQRAMRWTLQELPLPGRLVADVMDALYRENRFMRSTLTANVGQAVRRSEVLCRPPERDLGQLQPPARGVLKRSQRCRRVVLPLGIGLHRLQLAQVQARQGRKTLKGLDRLLGHEDLSKVTALEADIQSVGVAQLHDRHSVARRYPAEPMGLCDRSEGLRKAGTLSKARSSRRKSSLLRQRGIWKGVKRLHIGGCFRINLNRP